MGGNSGEPSAPDRREHLDSLLDEALAQTFPASDPVAIDIATRPTTRPMDETSERRGPGRARPAEPEPGEPTS